MPAGFITRLMKTCGTTNKGRRDTQSRMGALQNPGYLDEGGGGLQTGQYGPLGSYIDIYNYIKVYHFLKVLEASESSLIRDLRVHKHKWVQYCTQVICLGMAGGADKFHLEPKLATR